MEGEGDKILKRFEDYMKETEQEIKNCLHRNDVKDALEWLDTLFAEKNRWINIRRNPGTAFDTGSTVYPEIKDYTRATREMAERRVQIVERRLNELRPLFRHHKIDVKF